LNKITWLDNLGRATRSKKNAQLENFLTDLQRLTIVHEGEHGESHFRFGTATKAGSEDGGQEKKDDKPKAGKADSKDQKGKNKEESNDKYAGTSGGGAEEGDKAMADDHGASGAAEGQRRKDKKDDGPHMTDDDASGSDHTKVER
jgi:H+-transporting ATPase